MFKKIDKVFEYISAGIFIIVLVITLCYIGYRAQQAVFFHNMQKYEQSK